MEIFVVILVLLLTLGLIAFFAFFLDGIPIIEPLEKFEYITQMGVIFAPCFVMSTNEFGEPYTFQSWMIAIGLMLVCLLLTIFTRICIELLEERANRRQTQKLKKNKQKAVKNLLGKKAANKFQNNVYNETVEESIFDSKSKEKRKIRVAFALYLSNAKGSTLVAAFAAPIIIALNYGISKLCEPICILSLLLGIGLSLLCGYISKKLAPELC